MKRLVQSGSAGHVPGLLFSRGGATGQHRWTTGPLGRAVEQSLMTLPSRHGSHRGHEGPGWRCGCHAAGATGFMG